MSVRESFVMSRPSKTIRPPVGSSRRMMQRAIVDLPQPDSPTTPSVSPSLDAEADPVDRLHGRDLLLEDDPARDREVLRQALDDEEIVAARGSRRSAVRAILGTSARLCDRRREQLLGLAVLGLLVEMAGLEVLRLVRDRRRARAPSTCRRPSRTGSADGSGSRAAGSSSDGGWPWIWASRSTSASSRGSEPSRPHVYGWWGRVKISSTGPARRRCRRT